MGHGFAHTPLLAHNQLLRKNAQSLFKSGIPTWEEGFSYKGHLEWPRVGSCYTVFSAAF